MIMRQKLLEAAKDARAKAYAPYSHFTVGAALLSESGNIYTGCNVENASFGETCCAERVALFKAVSEGERRFVAMALCGGEENEPATPCTPCGSCRQVLAEFCGNDVLILTDSYEITLGELLPYAFRLTTDHT